MTDTKTSSADEKVMLERHYAHRDVVIAEENLRKAASNNRDVALALYHQLRDMADGVYVPADLERLNQLRGALIKLTAHTEEAARSMVTHRETLRNLLQRQGSSPSPEHEGGAPQGS